ncbi:ZP domain-containing protein [Caenorhabditis elegans]|uniref:ZP domain-containing protein n=1 Tax=Caenorhabditis elegans TaxID=6239 RepID=Q19379_CAEEL|nr:ZP domain-containing protein [Caenorhabditis elegans]CCD69411.1 ZP domain-containing protein [Caenorhabditis elegans]|eukprot:NP_509395.2 CUTiclin-Like [Caenorhabditis elegans]
MFIFWMLLWLIDTAQGEALITDKKVTCTSSNIEVALTFAKSFSGGVLTENPRKYEQCRWKGNGSNSMSINIPLFNSTKCAVVANETSGTYSIKLLVSPVDGLIVDGFSAINVKCIYATQDITLTLPPIFNGTNALQITAMNDDNSVVTGSGGSPALTMQILEGHGISGSPVVKAAVGQRITLDIALQNTAIYDFYVHSCYAHDGSNSPDASINIIDSNGCGVRLSRAIDVPAMSAQPTPNGPKHVYLHMYGFQFTSNNFVHFECQVKPCIKSCHREQCIREPDTKIPVIPAHRRRRHEDNSTDVATLRLETVLEISPQSTLSAAALVSSEDYARPAHCYSQPALIATCTFVFVITALLVSMVHVVYRRWTKSDKTSSINDNDSVDSSTIS